MPRQLLIRDAEILDGTGRGAVRGDLLVTGDVITGLEKPGTVPDGDRTLLDAAGLTLAPGFIDVHSHADNAPLLRDDDVSKILQGVTTEVVGNCGFSLAPRVDGTGPVLEAYSRRLFPELPWAWSSVSDLFAVTDDLGYVTNYASLVGHHALRIAVLGMADTAPDAEQLAGMGDLLDEALEAGAFGLSSGLIYPPGLYAGTGELVELARHLPVERPYVTHMRGEGTQLFDSLAEAVRIGREARRRVHISHLKASGRENWGRMGEALATLDEARDAGLDVRHDVYPYTAGSTMLSATLPPWFQEGGEDAILRRLEHAPTLEHLRQELEHDDGTWENWVCGAGWSGIVVASTPSHTHDGSSISQIATQQGIQPFEALVRVLVQERLHATMVVHSMHEDDLRSAMRHELTMIGSDGLPPGTGGKPHPRMYGTFPRVLARYSRQLGDLGLGEAVRRMTSLPAQSFGLSDRGVIAPGMAADIVAFDAATVQDHADYDDPTLPPSGIAWVMVNGDLAVRAGQYRGRRSGRRLRPRD